MEPGWRGLTWGGGPDGDFLDDANPEGARVTDDRPEQAGSDGGAILPDGAKHV